MLVTNSWQFFWIFFFQFLFVVQLEFPSVFTFCKKSQSADISRLFSESDGLFAKGPVPVLSNGMPLESHRFSESMKSQLSLMMERFLGNCASFLFE